MTVEFSGTLYGSHGIVVVTEPPDNVFADATSSEVLSASITALSTLATSFSYYDAVGTVDGASHFVHKLWCEWTVSCECHFH